MFITGKRPKLAAIECALPYAKLCDLPITPTPEKKLAVLAAGPIDPNLALKVEDRNDLLKSGYLPCEIGYCVVPSGTGFLADRAEMPGMTPEVFEWWFVWHSLEGLRYHIWDPEGRYYTRQQMREKTLDQSLPMRERTWDIVHHAPEDISPGPDELALEFRCPHELGYEKEKVDIGACTVLICANGHSSVLDQGVTVIMTHSVREIPGGIGLHPRLRIGYGLVDDRLVKLMLNGVSVPEEVPMGPFVHNLKEFGHLAVILPQVYAGNEDNW